jgi:hypothetical protein
VYVSGGRYEAWAAFLDRWGAGEPLDPATLPPLDPQHFAGDSWARLMDRISAALATRLQAWSDALSEAMAGVDDEFGVARALVHARWALPGIRALTRTPALPEAVRAQLDASVDGALRSMQEQLERGVERMRAAGRPRAQVEARLRTIRENPLTAAAAPARAADPWAADPAAAPRRRVIFD